MTKWLVTEMIHTDQDWCFTATCNCPHRCQLVTTAFCQNYPTHMDFPELSKKCRNWENEGAFDLAIERPVIYNIHFFCLKKTFFSINETFNKCLWSYQIFFFSWDPAAAPLQTTPLCVPIFKCWHFILESCDMQREVKTWQ